MADGDQIPPMFDMAKEASEALGYHFHLPDQENHRIARVSHGQKSVLLEYDRCYPINNCSSVAIVDDKSLTSKVLSSINVKTPRGSDFYVQQGFSEQLSHNFWKVKGYLLKQPAHALEHAAKLGYPVFVKPNDGTFGNLAQTVASPIELTEALRGIAQQYPTARIEEVVQGYEHRIYVLNGRVVFSYRKRPLTVTGDGRQTFHALLEALHHERSHIIGIANVSEKFINQQLAEQGLTRRSVLPKGATIALSPNANPNEGTYIDDFRREVPPACSRWATRIAEALNLNACGIDMFAPGTLNDHPNTFTVIEVNGNPLLTTIEKLGYRQLAVEIWQEVLQTYFQDRYAA